LTGGLLLAEEKPQYLGTPFLGAPSSMIAPIRIPMAIRRLDFFSSRYFYMLLNIKEVSKHHGA